MGTVAAAGAALGRETVNVYLKYLVCKSFVTRCPLLSLQRQSLSQLMVCPHPAAFRNIWAAAASHRPQGGSREGRCSPLPRSPLVVSSSSWVYFHLLLACLELWGRWEASEAAVDGGRA